jgi:surface polysaccharide O-acyltransferase-like enzyme
MATHAAVREPGTTQRLHYLDWLRVLAIFMVFVFHAIHVFDFGGWQIKNAEQSELITIILTVLSLWGMPFFFLVAGAASWFALQRRTPQQYLSERLKRLAIPFVVGSLLFSPLQYWLWWQNKVFLGAAGLSFAEFIRTELPPFQPLLLRAPGFSPKWIATGFHLWFIGFLFLYAVITLPLFRWLLSEAGARLRTGLAQWCRRRGGIAWFVLAFIPVELVLRPFFPQEHDWADFLFRMCFFILGYVLYSDPDITQAVRRDWGVLLTLGTACVAAMLGMYLADLPVFDWAGDPSTPWFYLIHSLTTIVAVSYSLVMVFVGMRFLNVTNRLLVYSQEAVLPFFMLHQPAIVVIAFFVVQWNAGIPLKLVTVLVSSFAVALGLYELAIRRISFLRVVFGMHAGSDDRRRRLQPREDEPAT